MAISISQFLFSRVDKSKICPCGVITKYPEEVCYSRISLVVPNYEAAPRLFYSVYFWQRNMNCVFAAHQELMGSISSIWFTFCEFIKDHKRLAYRSTSIYRNPREILIISLKKSLIDFLNYQQFQYFDISIICFFQNGGNKYLKSHR